MVVGMTQRTPRRHPPLVSGVALIDISRLPEDRVRHELWGCLVEVPNRGRVIINVGGRTAHDAEWPHRIARHAAEQELILEIVGDPGVIGWWLAQIHTSLRELVGTRFNQDGIA